MYYVCSLLVNYIIQLVHTCPLCKLNQYHFKKEQTFFSFLSQNYISIFHQSQVCKVILGQQGWLAYVSTEANKQRLHGSLQPSSLDRISCLSKGALVFDFTSSNMPLTAGLIHSTLTSESSAGNRCWGVCVCVWHCCRTYAVTASGLER